MKHPKKLVDTGAVKEGQAGSVAVTVGLSREKLANPDMAHAPPFNPSRDFIHIAVGKLL